MFIPSLPTDNIYKMFFIAGLAIILSSTLIYVNQKQSLQDRTDKFREEVILIDNEIEYQTGVILKSAKKMLSDSENDEIQLKQKPHSIPIETLKEKKRYNDTLSQHLEKVRLKRIGNQELKNFKADLLERDKAALKLYFWLYLLVTACGGGLTGYGLEKWQKLIQEPHDEKIKLDLEQLKRNIQKEIENNQII